MKVKITSDQHGQKIYEILWPNTQLEFFLADRNSGIDSDKGAVYILMDKYRRCFYIGETGSTSGGGIFNRFQTHRWEKEFWDCALVVSDSHGDFKQDDIRKWFEWKLNDIAKAANTAVVLSSAGRQNEPFGVSERLNAILAVCRFVGISWAFKVEERLESVPVVKPNNLVKPKQKMRTAAKSQLAHWTGKTQLAKIIASQNGNIGAFGGILQYFADKGSKVRKPCHSGSKWRKPLEEVGIKFDKEDYVIDWRSAKNPV